MAISPQQILTQQAQAVVSRIALPEPPSSTLKITKVEIPTHSGLTVPGSTMANLSQEQLERKKRLRDLLNRQVEEDDE
jgi:hypothetical protein